MIKIFVDGSCKPTNPGPAGIGGVVIWENENEQEFSEYIGEATNNIAEIRAFEKALNILIEQGKEWEEVSIYTDSNYVVGLFSKGWNAKANIDLVASVRKKLENFPNLTLTWVKGHNNDKFNELADKLAGLAVERKIMYQL